MVCKIVFLAEMPKNKSFVERNIFSVFFIKMYSWRKNMAYTKPQVIAQNASTGSYAAGCPAQNRGSSNFPPYSCISCERTK